MDVQSYSIEEHVEFQMIIQDSDIVTFCYPIYGSSVPIIVKIFVQKYKKLLNGKKLIIFNTQAIFSGDGARALVDLLDGINIHVIYADSFKMPLNIPNFPLVKVKNGERISKKIKHTNKKLDGICENISSGIEYKRGFNKFSQFMGYYSQRKSFEKLEKKYKNGVQINDSCIRCQKCVRVCPMKNLYLEDNKIQQYGNCTSCLRCVNGCPKKAITVFLHGKVKEQYKGIK